MAADASLPGPLDDLHDLGDPEPWLWAFLGEFPAAGLALGSTLRAWAEHRQAISERNANERRPVRP